MKAKEIFAAVGGAFLNGLRVTQVVGDMPYTPGEHCHTFIDDDIDGTKYYVR